MIVKARLDREKYQYMQDSYECFSVLPNNFSCEFFAFHVILQFSCDILVFYVIYGMFSVIVHFCAFYDFVILSTMNEKINDLPLVLPQVTSSDHILSGLFIYPVINSVKCLILEPYIGEEERIRHDALFFSQNPEDGLLLSGK